MVSTVITTYGGKEQLQRAIDSVLLQSYSCVEVIVVDDNNPETDARKKTEQLMRKYANDKRVEYVKHDRNCNGAAARNTGICRAKGEYIAFLDDDDYYLPERFEKILTIMERDPSYVGIYTGVELKDEKNKTVFRITPTHDLSIETLLLDEMALGTGSNIFLKKEVVRASEGFDENFVRRQDIEFMIRICEIGKVGFIDEVLVIKSDNGIVNHPKYEKMKTVINQFTDKFDKHIKQLGLRRKDYYCTQYRSLFNIALYEHDKDEIKEAVEFIQQYGHLTLKERILTLIYIHNIRESKLVISLIGLARALKNLK